MPDYRTFYDQEHLGAWDLSGNATVTISAVKAGEVGGHQGKKKDRKPILTFEGKSKTFVCNKTNAKTIAAMYGNDTSKWVGKRITLYPTTTPFGGEMKDCIRVRPIIPKNGAREPGFASPEEADAKRLAASGEVPADEEPQESGGEADGDR
jgi:hypothetical protein